jgi:dephospho-CoA kinase
LKTIGLTGGIGSGKSEVARLLGELGAEVISADLVGHEVYTPHTEGWQAIIEAFGKDILNEQEEVDRRKLGGIVFSDPDKLTLLNSIMWPRIWEKIEERLTDMRQKGAEVAIVEAAILIEGGWASHVDEVWTTESNEGDVVERVKIRNNATEEQTKARIAAQMSNQERAEYAHVIIRNDSSLNDLSQKVSDLWQSQIEGKG